MAEFPQIMGVLNVTPDSFSDGGMFDTEEKAIEQGLKLWRDGADIIDIGGESTRPGAKYIEEALELRRTLPVIKALKSKAPDMRISIDTTKYDVAKAALSAGAGMINDISGLNVNPDLASLAAEYDVPIILMHIQGEPRNMQKEPHYDNVVDDIFNELKEKIEIARTMGAKEIYADFGIGFGKTYEHNIELLKNIDKFRELNVPLVLGISRKSFMKKMLNIDDPQERDIPTALIHALLLKYKIDIIRVHNVEMINMLKNILHALSD